MKKARVSAKGSSACSGNLDMNEARGLVDKSGIKLPDALKSVGIDFESVKNSGMELKNAAAYLELHIEQGPVLLDLNLPLGAVLGTFGVERHAVTFHGQAAHSGSTPMNRRKDAFLAAAKMSPYIYSLAAQHGGVCTIGSCTTKPGIVTSVVEDCRITLDQRHLDKEKLERLYWDARDASEQFAEDANVEVHWERLWQIAPCPFHEELITFCDDAIRETCGKSHRLPSGPLHDAAEVASTGVPTVMMFVQSLHGISHNKIEDTKEEHLEMCVTAFDKLTEKTIGWLQKTI
jgi:hydantoinase/carbamoylase family amidase